MNAALCCRLALWFVGLPGSGKSSVAREVLRLLEERGLRPLHLEMDKRRKQYIPKPQYTREEREKAYGMFVDEAAALVAAGECVLMDGTAHLLHLRQQGRDKIGAVGGFVEVYVACSLETAMKREAARPQGQVAADLYRKAMERKRNGTQFEGLGEVIGVDEPFEENPDAEIRLNSETHCPEANARLVLEHLEGRSKTGA